MLYLIALTFVLAGLVKGVIGMGLPTVAVGVLSVFMTPAQAAALMVLPSLVTNMYQALAGPSFRTLLRRFGSFFAALCAGTWITAATLPAYDARIARAALGATLIAYALADRVVSRAAVSQRTERWLSPCVGFVTGAISAVTGVFVVPSVPYLQRVGLERDALVQALGLTFAIATLALAASLAGTLRTMQGAYGPVAALVAAAIGMALGQRMRRAMSPRVFRACFFWGLLLLGAHLVLAGVWR